MAPRQHRQPQPESDEKPQVHSSQQHVAAQVNEIRDIGAGDIGAAATLFCENQCGCGTDILGLFGNVHIHATGSNYRFKCALAYFGIAPS